MSTWHGMQNCRTTVTQWCDVGRVWVRKMLIAEIGSILELEFVNYSVVTNDNKVV